tara:strand:+ start:1659 stop:2417 length:759 start_codon:yes stop_codon:yes gene_type:complete
MVVGLLVLFLGIPAGAEERVVRVARLQDYAPFCGASENIERDQNIPSGDDAVGFGGNCWDVLRESYHQEGFTIQLFVVPWARAMSYLNQGKADILFPEGKNQEREWAFDYPEEPTNQANFVVYVRADNSVEWDGLAPVARYRIGVKRGFNCGDQWKAAESIRKHEVGSIVDAFVMLSQKRLDGVVGYEGPWDYVLGQEGWQERYRKLPAFDASLEYPVALKSNGRGRMLLDAFDRGKRHLVKTGVVDSLKAS